MKNSFNTYIDINWKEKDEEEVYNFFDNLEDPIEQAKFLIFMVKNYPDLELIYIEFIEDIVNVLLFQQRSNLVEEMVNALDEALPEEYSENYEFIEKSLIQYYFFKNDLSKVLERLEIIKQNPARGIHTITLRSLYLLIYHGYYQEAYEYSLAVWHPIYNSNEVLGMGHASLVINIYLFELEQAYQNILQNLPVDWNTFHKRMKIYGFDEDKEVMDTVIHCLEHPFNKEEIIGHIKIKQHRHAYTMMNVYFLKYMKDKYKLSFTHSDLFFNILTKEDLYKNKNNQENYFLLSFDKLDKQLSNLFDSMFLSNTEEMFGKVYGLEYVYHFIHECEMISDEGFEQMIENIRTIKYQYICIANEELWKMNFVHKWPHLYVPDPSVERIFKLTYMEDPTEISEAFTNYKWMLYQTLPIKLKEKVKTPDEYLEYDDLDHLFDPEDFGFSSHEPYIKEELDIGRNDLCPCGSGKKYKKCCLGII